jgi:hypothetical protein
VVELATPTARYLGPADRDLLAAFRCSRGSWYENRVEQFIREQLADYHEWRAPHTDHQMIGLELPDRGLVAVAAHEEDLVVDGRTQVTSTYWEIAAVATELQGAVLPQVPAYEPERPVTLGRHLAAAALSSIVDTGRHPVVRAVVARENARSLAMCSRVGLLAEREDEDLQYVQRWGVIAC